MMQLILSIARLANMFPVQCMNICVGKRVDIFNTSSHLNGRVFVIERTVLKC